MLILFNIERAFLNVFNIELHLKRSGIYDNT
ncbi:hypothetical protein JEOSCH030_01064 [Phocicoccus schoeneichii]|uniref:Uncharacterized protein n=1 Tax=Phocicoccus schoeneichii TaxID=1812261 RepID=A0A6V7RH69_9BACL|nr:hypothetical protein JEOSCH030_01064 [Jeotgalicoccus schoeneichii]